MVAFRRCAFRLGARGESFMILDRRSIVPCCFWADSHPSSKCLVAAAGKGERFRPQSCGKLRAWSVLCRVSLLCHRNHFCQMHQLVVVSPSFCRSGHDQDAHLLSLTPQQSRMFGAVLGCTGPRGGCTATWLFLFWGSQFFKALVLLLKQVHSLPGLACRDRQPWPSRLLPQWVC